MKTRVLFTVITLLIFTVCVRAQVVKGKVVDAATGNPIAHASIYLNGTPKGTTSNTQGEFVLYTDETKKALVVSYVGYQSETILDYDNILLNIKLKQRKNELKEVVIGGSGMSREEQMKIFLTQFLGSTKVEDCYIDNPDDINFSYNKKVKTLKANASEPLNIINKKLGYRITYLLSAFSYSRKKKGTSYKGNYVFSEDTLGLKPAEIKSILKARDKVYYGSRMHFIRSLWANDLGKTKFSYAYNNGDSTTHFNFFFNNIKVNKEQLLNNTITTTLVNGIEHFLHLPCMLINYNGSNESHLSFQSATKDVPITPISYNQSGLMWSGKFGEQRVSELLPIDFEPSEPLFKP